MIDLDVLVINLDTGDDAAKANTSIKFREKQRAARYIGSC